jgi:hypothetical protein
LSWASERVIESASDIAPDNCRPFPLDPYTTHVREALSIRAATERLLWHQRLGHPSDFYLYGAHGHIDGVLKLKHFDPILKQCPNCIRSKQTKEPAGDNSTRTAVRPFQGPSIDSSFPSAAIVTAPSPTPVVGCAAVVPDFPLRLADYIDVCSLCIGTHLNKDKMFPDQRAFSTIVRKSFGKGYEALRLMIMQTSLLFAESPGDHVRNPLYFCSCAQC